MQKILTYFAIFFCICCTQSSYAQFKTTRSFSNKRWLCSSTFVTDSLGLFFYETGCEGRSHIAMGCYTIKNDTISFNFSSLDTLPPFSYILESGPVNDTTVKITLLTRFGRPFIRKIDEMGDSGKIIATTNANDKGELFINPKKVDSIKLNSLHRFYHKDVCVKIGPRNLKVTLGLPGLFFSYRFSFFMQMTNFSMLVKKDGLYDISDNSKVYSLNE